MEYNKFTNMRLAAVRFVPFTCVVVETAPHRRRAIFLFDFVHSSAILEVRAV